MKDTEIGNWYEINAVVGGEIVTLQVKESSTAADKLVKNAQGWHRGSEERHRER